jgi:hypothetical protein
MACFAFPRPFAEFAPAVAVLISAALTVAAFRIPTLRLVAGLGACAYLALGLYLHAVDAFLREILA